ncbi:MAG: glycosyltransferase family 4 protein [Phycisphaerales bacterium]|nr:glycosyltransferase family 4 protein [Phycisphaerales bacterium]
MTGPILQINTEPGWRGGEQQTLHLAQGLAESAAVVVVGLESGALIRRAAAAGLETATVPTDRGLRGVRALRSLVRSLQPEIVHAHASKSHQLARMAGVGSGASLVVTRRVAFPLKRGPVARWKYVRGVAAYGAISQAVRRELMAGGVPADRIAVIPSAEDFAAIDAADPADLSELGLPDGAFCVLHAGALTAEKNHELLFAAWPDIKARHPRAHLLIAGAGSREAELKRLAASLSLADIHWLGFRSDIHSVIKQADLFLNTSRSEGLCSSLIQVRRCGVPIVATAVGGVPEVVEDEVSGLLIQSDDASGLASAACRVIEDRDMMTIRTHVSSDMDRFTVAHMVAGYRDLYAQL